MKLDQASLLLAAGGAALVPRVWAEHLMGNYLAEPFIALIPRNPGRGVYPAIAVVSCAAILSFSSTNAELGKNPMVLKVFSSMGMNKAKGASLMSMLRNDEFSLVCQTVVHAGNSCHAALWHSFPTLLKLALKDFCLFYGIFFVRAVVTRQPTPTVKEFFTSVAFMTSTFASLRALICAVSRYMEKDGDGATVFMRYGVIPLIFGLSMVWLALENPTRQRRIVHFVVAAALMNILRFFRLRPTNALATAFVAARFYPTVKTMVEQAVKQKRSLLLVLFALAACLYHHRDREDAAKLDMPSLV